MHSQLCEYIANSLFTYKKIAKDKSELGLLTINKRKIIRTKFMTSPACDVSRLTKEFEKLFTKLTQAN